MLLPEQGEIRPDGEDDGDIAGEHIFYLGKQPAASDPPCRAEGEPVTTEKAVESSREHDPVDAELRDHGEKAPRELLGKVIVFAFVNTAVLGRFGKKVTAAAGMKAAQIEQQVERRDHAAAHFAHVMGSERHLVPAEGAP